MIVDVDGLTFDFPADWNASKYDDWKFYRLRFGRMWSGIKSIDVIAIDPETNVWLIEVKDYRQHARTKPTDLPEEVAHKVFDTLAALLPARTNADDKGEVDIAKKALRGKKIRVVLHLEQPAKHSKLFPRAIDPANVKQVLRRLLKPIDAHPFVAEMAAMGTLAWSVR